MAPTVQFNLSSAKLNENNMESPKVELNKKSKISSQEKEKIGSSSITKSSINFHKYKESNEKSLRESKQYNEFCEYENLHDSKRSFDNRPLDTFGANFQSEWGSPRADFMLRTFQMTDAPPPTSRDEYMNIMPSQLRSPKFLEVEFPSYGIQTESYSKLDSQPDEANVLLAENNENIMFGSQTKRNGIYNENLFISNNSLNAQLIGMSLNIIKEKSLTEILEEDSINRDTDLHVDGKKPNDGSLDLKRISLTNYKPKSKSISISSATKETSLSTVLVDKTIITNNVIALQETSELEINKNSRPKNYLTPLSIYYY